MQEKITRTSSANSEHIHSKIEFFSTLNRQLTRRTLAAAHVPPTKVFRRLTGSVNKTMLKALLAAAANMPTYTSDFSPT